MMWLNPKTIFRSDPVVALYLGCEDYWIMSDHSLQPYSVEGKRKCNIVVLGREHYSETVATLPMTSMEDIRAAIGYDPESYLPDSCDVSDKDSPRIFFLRRLGSSDNGTEVNIWALEKDILKRLNTLSPLWIIPETALLGVKNNASRELWQVERPDGSLLLVGDEANGAVRSILNYDQLADIDSLTRVLGGEFSVDRHKLDAKEWVGYLCSALLEGKKKLPSLFFNMVYNWQNFWFRTGWEKRFGNLRQHLRTVAVVLMMLLIYCGAQLCLPWYLNRDLTTQVNKIKPSVNEVLKKRNELKVTRGEIDNIIEAFSQVGSRTALLDLIAKNFPEKGRISKLSCTGSQVEINGVILDGGQYLKLLGQDSRVKSARFKSPLQADRNSNMKRFSLTFHFSDEKNEQK